MYETYGLTKSTGTSAANIEVEVELLPYFKRHFLDMYESVKANNVAPRRVLREFQDALEAMARSPPAERMRIARRVSGVSGTAGKTYVFECLLEIARRLYRFPYIMYHNVSLVDKQRNDLEMERLLVDATNHVRAVRATGHRHRTSERVEEEDEKDGVSDDNEDGDNASQIEDKFENKSFDDKDNNNEEDYDANEEGDKSFNDDDDDNISSYDESDDEDDDTDDNEDPYLERYKNDKNDQNDQNDKSIAEKSFDDTSSQIDDTFDEKKPEQSSEIDEYAVSETEVDEEEKCGDDYTSDGAGTDPVEHIAPDAPDVSEERATEFGTEKEDVTFDTSGMEDNVRSTTYDINKTTTTENELQPPPKENDDPEIIQIEEEDTQAKADADADADAEANADAEEESDETIKYVTVVDDVRSAGVAGPLVVEVVRSEFF